MGRFFAPEMERVRKTRYLWLFPLAFAALEDAATGWISDIWAVLIGVSGLVCALAGGQAVPALLSFLFILTVYGVLFLLCPEGLGEGDLFLSLAVSLWLSPEAAALFLLTASVLSLPEAILSLLAGSRKGLRFGPYLALGGGIAFVVQETLPSAFPWFSLV